MKSARARVAISAVMLASTLWVPASARASSIVIDVTGTADLSSFGASSASTYHGVFAWDAGSSPVDSAVDYADYAFTYSSFSINAVDHSAAIWLAGNHAAAEVVDGGPAGVPTDELDIVVGFQPLVDLGVGPDLYFFVASFAGPDSMFSSLAPPDLSFLSVATDFTSYFYDYSFDVVGTGTLTGAQGEIPGEAPVPEPASLLLLGSALALVVLKTRFVRSR